MRLKAEIWVHAYVRRCAAESVPAMVVRHGDDDAGAIWIKVNRLDGTASLYGPAPAGLSAVDTDRRWTVHLPEGTADGVVEQRLAREREFDSDIWVIEVEDRKGRHFLEDWMGR